MIKKYVKTIFIKNLTPGDFWTGERAPHTNSGGGGGTYFDVPLGSISAERLADFCGSSIPENGRWPELPILAAVLGDPIVTQTIEFGARQNNGRYKINNQSRRIGERSRHAAWTSHYGFPEISDADASLINGAGDRTLPVGDPRVPDVSNVRLLIIRTICGSYYASFINTAVAPLSWPTGIGLERVFRTGLSAEMVDFSMPLNTLSPKADEIIQTWRAGKKNVLLYGPPGTGKTHVLQELWEYLGHDGDDRLLVVDPDQPVETAFTTEPRAAFPGPIRRDWVTFHQNYSYEQFILALRPKAELRGTGTVLKPRAGVLLDAAMSLHDGTARTAVMFIDEVNRGNVSRIFGEFITFMDDEYRTTADGNTSRALPVPLGMVSYMDGQTEPIERMHGGEFSLPAPWHFPNNLYVVATMNSVDRAVAPLDTALARRFARVELPPDMKVLAGWLDIPDTNSLLRTAAVAEEQAVGEEQAVEDEDPVVEPEEALAPPVQAATGEQEAADGPQQAGIASSPAEVAFLLLYRMNYILASTLGPDFEIGHTYLLRVSRATTDDDKWLELARIWDQALFPQLRERFNNRQEILTSILRADPNGLIRPRKKPAGGVPPGADMRPILDMPSLEEAFNTAATKEKVKKALSRFAGL